LSILSILEFPDERLRKKAAIVQKVDDKVKKLVDDMLETMYESHGVGINFTLTATAPGSAAYTPSLAIKRNTTQ